MERNFVHEIENVELISIFFLNWHLKIKKTELDMKYLVGKDKMSWEKRVLCSSNNATNLFILSHYSRFWLQEFWVHSKRKFVRNKLNALIYSKSAKKKKLLKKIRSHCFTCAEHLWAFEMRCLLARQPMGFMIEHSLMWLFFYFFYWKLTTIDPIRLFQIQYFSSNNDKIHRQIEYHELIVCC